MTSQRYSSRSMMAVERIVAYFGENGFDIDKQTVHGLLKKTAWMAESLHKAMRSAAREDGYLHCDETYHTVLVKAGENGGRGSRKGYLWAVAAHRLGLAYFFYEDGSRVVLKELEGYSGTIQSDGLKAYKKLAANSEGKILRLSCLQHCKRDFVDMRGNPDADRVLGLANELYAREHEHKIGHDSWTAEDNLKWRREYAPPILSELKGELLRIQAQTDKYPPKSQMSSAVNYFLNEWDGIEAIATGGDYDWDNNLIERINRHISLSRKNSMFFGSHAGAERGCVFYSLACSCRLHRIDFFEYFSDVLHRMAHMPCGAKPEAFRDLLPNRWKKQKLMEQLNGNIHYQIFCGIRIDPERPLKNYKLIDDIAEELANLSYRKQRKHSNAQTRKMTRRLLNLLGKILKEIRRMGREHEGQELLTVKEKSLVDIVTKVYRQQRNHFGSGNRRESIPDRIVSVSKPYVRPIVSATAMEGSFGTQKEHYAMRRINARKKETEILYIFFGIHTANAVRLEERLLKGREAEAA